MSCGIVCRSGSDPTLLWCRMAATALIRPLAWELPYAIGVSPPPQKKLQVDPNNRALLWPGGRKARPWGGAGVMRSGDSMGA